MNEILSITVGATLENPTRSKNCAATCTQMGRNEKQLGLNIIHGYLFF